MVWTYFGTAWRPETAWHVWETIHIGTVLL